LVRELGELTLILFWEIVEWQSCEVVEWGNRKQETPKKSLRGRPETGKDQKYVREIRELVRIILL